MLPDHKERMRIYCSQAYRCKRDRVTAKYIDRFHTMEQIIADHIPQGKELLALAVLEVQKTINDLQSNNAALLEDNKRMKPKEALPMLCPRAIHLS